MNGSQWKASSRPSHSVKNTRLMHLSATDTTWCDDEDDESAEIWIVKLTLFWSRATVLLNSLSFLPPSPFVLALLFHPNISPDLWRIFTPGIAAYLSSFHPLFSSTLMHVALLLSHREFVVFCPSFRGPPPAPQRSGAQEKHCNFSRDKEGLKWIKYEYGVY